jgi:methionyl-tRNA formyltransferase
MKPRIIFMGTPEFAVAPLSALLARGDAIVAVVCQPDRPQGRHLQTIATPVSQVATARGIPVLQPEKVRTPEFAAALRAFDPDLIVTAAYGRILPPDILAIPRLGCLNLHASLLPRYRGAAPINWCLIRGERQTGVTIMLMDEGMDTGAILARRSLPIPDDIDAGQLSQQLAHLGAELLPAVVDDWVAGRLSPVAQNEAEASYAPILTRETGLIDWQASAATVHNLIRGTAPWPGASTWCGDKRLKIHQARVCADDSIIRLAEGVPPGTICLCGGLAISVACGFGVIDLLEIQSESGKRLHCRDCAHNYRLGQVMGGDRDV